MHSVRSFQGPITTFGKLFSRYSVLAAKRRGQKQHVVTAASFVSRSLTLMSTQCQLQTPFRMQPTASTKGFMFASTLTKSTNALTSSVVVARPLSARVFSIAISQIRNLSIQSSSLSPPSSPDPSSSSSLSDKTTSSKPGSHTNYARWSVKENVKITELMKDNISYLDMLPYFPNRTKDAVYKHIVYLRHRLKTLGATISDLEKPEIRLAMTNNLKPQQWSKEQDALLQDLYKQHGPKWELIKTLVSERGKKDGHLSTELFPERNITECQNRIDGTRLDFNRGPWSEQELNLFWESIEEVELDYKSRGGDARIKPIDKVNGSQMDEHAGMTAKGEKFVPGFWKLVAEKVHTRSRKQCAYNYHNLKIGKVIETGGGRERIPWTVEELQALRDLKTGREIIGWESKEIQDRINGKDKKRKLMESTKATVERWRKARAFLGETRTDVAIKLKAAYIQRHAKSRSLSISEYFDWLMEKQSRMGFSKAKMKEREELIAEKFHGSSTADPKLEN